MWRTLAISISICMAATAAVAMSDNTRSIGALLERAMPASGSPGVAFAYFDTETVHSGARGEMRAGSGQRVTADTPFVIGSVSKGFTALAVLQLIEAGHFELDSQISGPLDVFADQPGAAITIRQLLSHTSGYSTLQGNWSHTDETGQAGELAQRVGQLAETAPTHAPDSRWQYSNANYLILGRLIEVVSGRDFAEYVESEILEPAGMANSFVADGEIHDNIATGHNPWFGTRRVIADRRTSRAMAPAGGIIASANDMARYLSLMVNDQDDLISAQSKALMLSPASPLSSFYGLGWVIDMDAGTASHTGLSPGVETIATLSLSEQQGAVVLVNANSGFGFGVTADLLYGITALALDEDYQAGADSYLQSKALYLMLVILPAFFVFAMIKAWLSRPKLRAKLQGKSGLAGLFSLWFPLLTTTAMAWVFVFLFPRLFGVPLATLNLYQPDLVILLIAASVTGVAMAVLRLAVAYSGRSPR